MHRNASCQDQRRTRSEIHIDQLCGTEQSYHADEHAPIHAANECFLEKGGEPEPCREPAFHVLQLCANPSDVEGYTRDGSGGIGSRVVGGGDRLVAKLTIRYPFLKYYFPTR